MKKTFFFPAILFILNLSLMGQPIPIPANYVILGSVAGDLDKDGIQEMVVVFDTRKPIQDFDNIPKSGIQRLL